MTGKNVYQSGDDEDEDLWWLNARKCFEIQQGVMT